MGQPGLGWSACLRACRRPPVDHALFVKTSEDRAAAAGHRGPGHGPRVTPRSSSRCVLASHWPPRTRTGPPAATSAPARSTTAAAPTGRPATAEPGQPLSWQPQPPLIVLSSHTHDHLGGCIHIAHPTTRISPVHTANGGCRTRALRPERGGALLSGAARWRRAWSVGRAVSPAEVRWRWLRLGVLPPGCADGCGRAAGRRERSGKAAESRHGLDRVFT